jgi:hypothetical protein
MSRSQVFNFAALERMATKDELRDVNETLRSIQESIAPHRR